MGSRRRRRDPVGPFGNPDGSRADIEDLITEFVDFSGDPAYGHLATRANDSMVRVIVGKLGGGQDGLPAASSGFPGTSGLRLCRCAAAELAEDRSGGEGMPVVLGQRPGREV